MDSVDWVMVLERYGVLGIVCLFMALMSWRFVSWLTKIVFPRLMTELAIPLKDRSLKFFDGLEETHELLKESAKNTDRAVNQIVKDRLEDRKVLEDILNIMSDTWNPPRRKDTHLRGDSNARDL